MPYRIWLMCSHYQLKMIDYGWYWRWLTMGSISKMINLYQPVLVTNMNQTWWFSLDLDDIAQQTPAWPAQTAQCPDSPRLSPDVTGGVVPWLYWLVKERLSPMDGPYSRWSSLGKVDIRLHYRYNKNINNGLIKKRFGLHNSRPFREHHMKWSPQRNGKPTMTARRKTWSRLWLVLLVPCGRS